MKPVILFDGECGLCSAVVRWVVRHDREGAFLLASLQSQAALRLLGREPELDSVLLVDAEGIHWRSEAVLRILGRLPRWRRLALLLRAVPSPWRDSAYRTAAALRRRTSTGHASCLAPSPALGSRFLDPDGGQTGSAER